MTKMKNLVLCAVASVTVVACAKCPETGDYGRVPYSNTRTAGTGMAEYGGNCPTVQEEAPVVVQQQETVVTPPPAPVAPQPEPPVFREQQTK